MKKYLDLNILKKSKSVAIIAHSNPDSDALASAYVLHKFLNLKFGIHDIDIFADCKSVEEQSRPLLGNLKLNKHPKTYDTAISIDTANIERMGEYSQVFENSKTTIVLDHHATNNISATVRHVEQISSCCELLFYILKEFNFMFTKDVCSRIYSGLITDTNNFTVGNFSSSTFDCASFCSNFVQKSEIYRHFFANSSLINTKLYAKAIENLKEEKNCKFIVSYISLDQQKNLNANFDDYTGIINRLMTIHNCKMCAFIHPKTETENYVSLRAVDGFDVASIATQFGGGGHKGASGFVSTQSHTELTKLLFEKFNEQSDRASPSSASIFN